MSFMLTFSVNIPTRLVSSGGTNIIFNRRTTRTWYVYVTIYNYMLKVQKKIFMRDPIQFSLEVTFSKFFTENV